MYFVKAFGVVLGKWFGLSRSKRLERERWVGVIYTVTLADLESAIWMD
jgi:hypothetical protein